MFKTKIISIAVGMFFIIVCVPPEKGGSNLSQDRAKLDSLRKVRCPRLMSSAAEYYRNRDWKQTVKIYREVITIRGIIAGEYIITAHYYSERDYSRLENAIEMGTSTRKKKSKELTVKIELHKVNPYTIMWVGEKKFRGKGQEETFVRFRLDKDGTVLSPFTFEKKKFVTPLMALGGYQGSGAEAYEDGAPAR